MSQPGPIAEPTTAHVSTLSTLIDPGRLMCRLCRSWLALIGSCVDSVECDRSWLTRASTLSNVIEPNLLICRFRRLWSTLIGTCVDSTDGDWSCFALLSSLRNKIEPDWIMCRLWHSVDCQSGSIRVDTWANQSKSQWSYLTHEPIKVNNSQQSDTWADQGRS